MAPSTYYAAKKRELAPSARAVRDAVLMQVLMVLWVTNRKVYGAHKLWKAAVRAGHDIGRDQTARLMRELGIEGISRRRKRVFTTKSDPDLVNRQFRADRPDALCGHRTCVKTPPPVRRSGPTRRLVGHPAPPPPPPARRTPAPP